MPENLTTFLNKHAAITDKIFKEEWMSGWREARSAMSAGYF